jgi:uncharacterized phage-like protein YoqJ
MTKTVVVTGYKAHELGIFTEKHPAVQYLKKTIERKLIPLIEEGLEWVIISGQLGVELWSAEVVFELQNHYSDLKLAVLTPFLKQESRWKEDTQQYYESVLSRADFVRAISNRPYESPAQLRMKNEFLIEKSDALLVLFDEERPGSPEFYLKAARKKQKIDASYEILTISFEEVNMVIQDETNSY